MFYDCLSRKAYDEKEWLPVLAIECILAPILEMRCEDFARLTVSDLKGRILYLLGLVGFPPSEIEGMVTEDWLSRYLEDQIPAIKKWLSTYSPETLDAAEHPAGLHHVRFDKERFQACVKSSEELRTELRKEWWMTWMERAMAARESRNQGVNED